MAGPKPSTEFLAARRVLRDEAIERTGRRLGVTPDVMPAISGVAVAQLPPALGAVDPRQAGWVSVGAGTLIARNCESLATAHGDVPADRSFTAGLAWAALLVGVAGDRLLDADDPIRSGAWEPGEHALEARRLARELAEDPPGPRGLSGARFAQYALSELRRGLPQLEPVQAGYTLLVLAVWIAGHAERIAAPLVRRRLLRASTVDAAGAESGCVYVASVLAAIGEPLLGG